MLPISKRACRIRRAACALLAVVISGLGTEALASEFSLSSSDLEANGSIGMKHVFNGFGCEGENISPALSWSQPQMAPVCRRSGDHGSAEKPFADCL